MCDKTCLHQCNPYTYEQIEEIAQFLKSKVDIKPKIGIILGTGLGSVTSLLKNVTTINYTDIPNFPTSTVEGHDGKLLFGYIGPTSVVCMQGRFHLFEGYPLWKCVLPVRVMKFLGVTTLILSNAAGGINASFKTGDIMFIKDHINFVTFGGQNPLQGPNDERFGPRFVAMNDAYDKELLKIAKNLASDMNMKEVQEGVYLCIGGPSFETVAELRAMKNLGADAVGMSTVHEVITARHMGIKCFAFSLITNKCVLDYESKDKPDHEEILVVGAQRQQEVANFMRKFLEALVDLHLE